MTSSRMNTGTGPRHTRSLAKAYSSHLQMELRYQARGATSCAHTNAEDIRRQRQ